ncbi:MAG: lipid IV(A) 3-deoxy-D-manno-octulosonic acid transferase, partial [Methylococcales bacterium]
AVWFHAVSGGEVEALFPLVQQVQLHHPDLPLLVTCTTPTGSARITALLQDTVQHVYLPYDIPFAVKRFFRCFQPCQAVIMETEIWPNLYAYCGINAIPLYVINARLSEKSAAGYVKIPALIQPALAQVNTIATQTQADAERFIAIGAAPEKVKNLGNIKFDVAIPEATIEQGLLLKQQLFAGRFVWLLASTHQDEELLFLQIFPELKQHIPNLLLLIVPRHPERFTEVFKQCMQHNLNVVRRSEQQRCNADTDVYLADTMGELKMLYAAAELAFVGGSMVPVGGHNILEPAAIGVAVMFGPYMANFKEIAAGVLKQAAAIQCHTQQDIVNTLIELYQQPERRYQLAFRAKDFVAQNQGAVAKIYALLDKSMTELA